MNPKEILSYYGKVYPEAWKMADEMRMERGKELPFWPDWCFLPLAGSYSVIWNEAVKQGLVVGDTITNIDLIPDVGNIGALAAWRVTQGVYRFDSEVYESVINTNLSGDIPHDVFFNLPEWCLYIETPKLTFMGAPLLGFFVHLEYDINTHRKELRLVLNIDTGTNKPLLFPQILHLGGWSLLESIERAVKEAMRYAGKSTKLFKNSDKKLKELEQDYIPLVSLVLYICSANGEIGDGTIIPSKPKPKKTKKGLRLFPPQQAKTWNVGERMGAAIRKDKKIQKRTGQETSESARTSPRSHIRRAHWHGYWIGSKKKLEEREYVLKWIQPVLVNPKDGDLPTTIRPVE